MADESSPDANKTAVLLVDPASVHFALANGLETRFRLSVCGFESAELLPACVRGRISLIFVASLRQGPDMP